MISPGARFLPGTYAPEFPRAAAISKSLNVTSTPRSIRLGSGEQASRIARGVDHHITPGNWLVCLFTARGLC